MSKNTKLIAFTAVVIAVVAVVVVVMTVMKTKTPSDDKEIVIKFSHVTTETTPKGKGAILLKNLVDERLAGRVRVEIYPNSQLYNDKTALKALLLGDIHLAAPSLSKFSKYTKQWALFDLPFLFKNPQALNCFTNSDKGRELLNTVQNKGIKGLGYWLNGMKQISANRPLISPEDAAGLKFRIMSSDVLKAQFEALKANPQKMAFAEVYNALATNVIDGQENTWSNIRSKKFFEVQKHTTVSNHGVLEYALVTNKEFWDALPNDIRLELEKIIAQVTDKVVEFALEAAEKDQQAVVNSGKTKVHTLTHLQKQQWIDVMKPVWSQFENQVGKDNIAAVQQCNAQN
ncbi:MAG: TRAP transporter substrate-binding protein [Methylococcales symbiont of Hymedesmia sp. n. MRB-2018]|nr:MAG: TRAP transporter substrate-binding protein [Methylococcales symbiont of Hymedesmia sp. n. MRB-2018]